MSELLERLQGMLAVADAPLANFGFEFRRTWGRISMCGLIRWDEAWQVSGSGVLRCTTVRSLGDQPGAESGIWQTKVDPLEIRPLAAAMIEARLHEALPYHVEPGDMMARVKCVADGVVDSFLLSGDLPEHMNTLSPVRKVAAELMNRAMEFPLRTVGLSIELPQRIPKAKVRVPVSVVLHNSGVQGHWVRDPLSPLPQGELYDETMQLSYALRPVAVEGETPIPPTPVRVSLEPSEPRTAGPLEYIWLEPGAEVTFPMYATVDMRQVGSYTFWSEYSSYTTIEPLEGQARWAGAVFSQKIPLEIR